VQAVGQFDQQDANVLRHRQHQLAEILGLLGVVRLQLDARELGDAVDQPGDLLAEQLADILKRCAGILDDIVQQPVTTEAPSGFISVRCSRSIGAKCRSPRRALRAMHY
jgi:hypothetical protein